MAPDSRHAKLIAEIAELQNLQTKSIAAAILGGWSREKEATHDKRAERLGGLIRELEALEQE